MLNHLSCSPRLYFVSVILIAFPAIADVPMPAQDFWEYISEYSDENGDILDPLEYDQILSVKENEIKKHAETKNTDEKVVVDKVKVGGADIKFEQMSSLQSSHVGASGASL